MAFPAKGLPIYSAFGTAASETVRARQLSLPKKLVFATIVTVAGLLLIEGVCRLVLSLRATDPVQFQVAEGSVATDWLEILGDDAQVTNSDVDLYVEDRELFWALRPGTQVQVANAVYQTRGEPLTWSLSINDSGHRGPPYPTGGDAFPVVACLGDSCTFGFRVSDSETYPAQLRERLRSELPAAEVVNYGVPGYSSYQGRILLDRILAAQTPEVVVLAFGANDLEQDRYSDAAKAAQVQLPKIKTPQGFEKLAIVRLLRGARTDRRTAAPNRESTSRVSPAEYRENLTAMVQLAKQNGCRVVLLDLVFISTVFRDTIAEVAAENGLEWIDGREVLRTAVADLIEGDRFQHQKQAADRFWDEEVAGYRAVYYAEDFYQQLFADETWSKLLRYFMVEPVHANQLGNQVVAERLAEIITRQVGSQQPAELETAPPGGR